ncbi:MAG: hypothetical protein JXA67_16035 [Micromonosporaceae bacterium]|nr:hypothetical protein [Micromonosporaceae bacterium]
MVWYGVFTTSQIAGHPNGVLSHQLLGSDLSAHLLGGGHLLAFAPLVIALATLAAFTSWRMKRVALATGNPAPGGVFALLPFASVLGVLVLPLAAVVYLVTTQTWTAVENVVLRRGLPARTPGDAASRGTS